MRHTVRLFPLLFLPLFAAAPAWASCSTSVVDVGLVTTVTVTASANESCSWDDNNANNARLLSMAGTVVPNLLVGYRADFSAASVNKEGEKWPYRVSECNVVNIPGCIGSLILLADDYPSGEGVRDCHASNDDALSSTNVCIYERIVP